MKQTFTNLRAILQKHKENMPVIVVAEILAEIDEAENSKVPIRCLNCARYTDTDIIDNTCYLCCKGFEDSYIPKEAE